jgi:flavin reductase (DIM6/NTAB) family NADH-FMN oxidoreductase RutF
MTIGWGSLGIIWKRPIFTVYVRPSRFTYGLIEESGEFTVNVLPVGKEAVAKYCGSTSGRDVDKFAAQGLTAVPGSQVRTPIINECIIHFECRVIYKNSLVSEALDKPILTETYGNTTDFHRLYFGEIVACQRD